MNMLNRHINPRVLVIGLLEELDSRPLSRRELAMVVDALSKSGVKNAFPRFSDDCQRMAIENVKELI